VVVAEGAQKPCALHAVIVLEGKSSSYLKYVGYEEKISSRNASYCQWIGKSGKSRNGVRNTGAMQYFTCHIKHINAKFKTRVLT
jgi:hypothetical protein